MLFALIGVALIALHFVGIGPSATWTFTITGDLWKFVLPFILAVAWWTYADLSGLSRKREMKRLDDRQEERRRRSLEALGVDWRQKGRGKGSRRR